MKRKASKERIITLAASIISVTALGLTIQNYRNTPTMKSNVPATNQRLNLNQDGWEMRTNYRALEPTDSCTADVNGDGFLDNIAVEANGATYVDYGYCNNLYVPFGLPLNYAEQGDLDIEAGVNSLFIMNRRTGRVHELAYSSNPQNRPKFYIDHAVESAIGDDGTPLRFRLRLDANGKPIARSILEPKTFPKSDEPPTIIEEEPYFRPRPAPQRSDSNAYKSV